MTPTEVANAITQALIQGVSTWLVATIVAFLPALWTMTLVLHLGRPLRAAYTAPLRTAPGSRCLVDVIPVDARRSFTDHLRAELDLLLTNHSLQCRAADHGAAGRTLPVDCASRETLASRGR